MIELLQLIFGPGWITRTKTQTLPNLRLPISSEENFPFSPLQQRTLLVPFHFNVKLVSLGLQRDRYNKMKEWVSSRLCWVLRREQHKNGNLRGYTGSHLVCNLAGIVRDLTYGSCLLQCGYGGCDTWNGKKLSSSQAQLGQATWLVVA